MPISCGTKEFLDKKKKKDDKIRKEYPNECAEFEELPKTKDYLVLKYKAFNISDGLYVGETNRCEFRHGRGVQIMLTEIIKVMLDILNMEKKIDKEPFMMQMENHFILEILLMEN